MHGWWIPQREPRRNKETDHTDADTAVSRNTLSVLCRSICATFLNTNSTPVEEDKIDNVFVGERHVLFDLRLSRRDSTN